MAGTVQTGKLRHKLVIKSLSQSQDAQTGKNTQSWSGTDTRWASIEPLRGREFVEAQAIAADVDHRITMWSYSGLSPTTHRLVFGTRIFNIVHVADIDERGEYMEVMCREVR